MGSEISEHAIATLLSMVGFLMLLLVGILSWLGNRIHARLDAINTTLSNIEKDLRSEVSHLDRRVAVVEYRLNGGKRSSNGFGASELNGD